MSETKMKTKRRYNALDITVALLVLLLMVGAGTRIVLARRHSKGLQDSTVSFTCVVPEFEQDLFAQGNTLYTADGEKLGSITQIDKTVLASETKGDLTRRYVVITGDLLVKGYTDKNGVFYTTYGEPIRINMHISLKTGDNIQLYINDIVENGQ